MKKIVTGFLFALLLASTPAFAEDGSRGGSPSDKQCSMHGPDCSSKDCETGGGCPIVGKFMKKAHWLLSNQDELGLTSDQVDTVKALKGEMKRSAIRQEADMKIFMMDLEDKLSDETVDVEGLNAMLDKAGAGMTEGAKASVAAYVKLKEVLTPEQIAKAKELKKSRRN